LEVKNIEKNKGVAKLVKYVKTAKNVTNGVDLAKMLVEFVGTGRQASVLDKKNYKNIAF
jgi:hypothetical protein